MNYKQYIKLNTLFESLNSAKQKFDGTDDEFEKLKSLDPTSNKKWKYMDFIVKVGYQENLKDLLKDFEQLSNKGIIKNKDINSYNYEALKSVVNQSKNTVTKRQQKIKTKEKIKKDVIKVNDNPLVVIPLTKKTSIYYGNGTKWCTAYTKSKNYFNYYFFEGNKTLFYILDNRKWAIVLDEDGSLNSCWDDINTKGTPIKDITKATKITLKNCQNWFKKYKEQIDNARLLSDSALFKYIHENNIEKIKEIIKTRKDTNIVNDNNETLLSWACLENNIEIVKLLLDNGAQESVNIVDNDNETPLYWACFEGNIEMVKLLLDNGAQESVNIANTINRPPLYWACYKNNIEMVKLLLDNGAQESVNIVDNDNETPLYWACYKNNIEIVKLLLDNGAQESVNIANTINRPPLRLAKVHNNQKMIDLLKSYGAIE